MRLEDLNLDNGLDMSRISMGGNPNNPDMTSKEADIIASLQKEETFEFNPPQSNFSAKPPISISLPQKQKIEPK